MSESPGILTPTVLIIGGGPSGLRAAADLAPKVDGDVLVLERETEAGGIPRHSDHLGYGIRDMGRFISGPSYAAILRRRAIEAGARIMTHAMVTDWADELSVNVTCPEGRIVVRARAVILATGARERPRPARMIPGDRGKGVLTTGQLQNLVHLKHQKVGSRAVIVGAELVSWSAAMTLQHAGCRTTLMTTEYPQPDAYGIFSFLGRFMFRTRVATGTRVVRIFGKPRVQGVEIEDIATGKRRTVSCDTVILTGDWIPDHELARSAGLDMDPVSKAPVVDAGMRTSKPGVFAIGNLLHPVDTADIAALDGAGVVRHVLDHLAGHKPGDATVGLRPAGDLRWISPGLHRLAEIAPPRGRLLSWSEKFVRFPVVHVRQAGRLVARKRLLWPAAPGRVFRIPSSVLAGLDPAGGEVSIGLD